MNIEVAEKIIKIIEDGNVKAWQKQWVSVFNQSNIDLYNLVKDDMLAINAYTFMPYDVLFVPSGFYVTFKQIKDHKLHLNKGSKGVPNYKYCMFYKVLTNQEKEALNNAMISNEELANNVNLLLENKINDLLIEFKVDEQKTFSHICIVENGIIKYQQKQYVLEYLFKAEDCNIDIKELWHLEDEKVKTIDNEVSRIKRAENVKHDYIKRSKIKFCELGQDKAYYKSGSHEVVVPTINQFKNIKDYYQVVYHELAHSTGHISLLNRKTLMASCGFKSENYSREELVAELSSLYTLTSLKIINDDILQNSIAYLKSWGSQLKENIKHNILATIAQARKATNLILNIQDKAL